MRIMLVAGARPNFMKIAPVLAALDDQGADTILVHTGQHYDPLMSDVFFDELGIRKPDHHLEAGSGTHAQQTAAIMVAFEPLVDRLHPDVIAVPGDVNGTGQRPRRRQSRIPRRPHRSRAPQPRLVDARRDQPRRGRPDQRLPLRTPPTTPSTTSEPRDTETTRSTSSAT